MSALRAFWIVLRKELVDGVRDRRSLLSLAFSAVISPLLFGLMFTVVAERRKSADEIILPVAGAQHAPAFVAWLTQQTGVKVVTAPAEKKRLEVAQGKVAAARATTKAMPSKPKDAQRSDALEMNASGMKSMGF